MPKLIARSHNNRQTFSEYFHLGKQQHELDFVDIPINNGDISLFIDPYALSKRNDRWSIECHNFIVSFFQRVVDLIRAGQERDAKYMLSGLKEPNQTRFGLSVGKLARGRGVSGSQAEALYEVLAESSAVKTGFLKDLEECELLIDGIGTDKISDITTNIIRGKLIEYTQNQCSLWDVPMHDIPSGQIWDQIENRWLSTYVPLPVCYEKSVLLVPKAIARFSLEFSHQEYYQHFVLNFIQEEHMSAGSSLVRVLKDGTRRPPTKKALKKLHPNSKQFLYSFSKDHPEVLKQYRQSKTYKLSEIESEDINELNKKRPEFDYDGLKAAFAKINSGDADADKYHNHMVGALSAIFYPTLISPKKEQPIHGGRKKIDISFENAAKDGFFWTLPQNKQVPSSYIFIECKNYSSDPANPELDQLSGRFSTNRGKFGFLVCRRLSNKPRFIQRCKDTAQDGRGFIVVLDDSDIKKLLDFRKNNRIRELNDFLETEFKKLVM
ncbi:hypothetical protein C4568_00215 [Candidatus Parcubacteria bacterium]|nr:MAG: hypothetical protein C4568_00215 [Candidatus Parcubacteria bacterium]